MRVAYVGRDLMMGSRIVAAADAAGASLVQVEEPAALPAPDQVDLVLVDWHERGPGWGELLRAWCSESRQTNPPRVVLFGSHTDLESHAAARDARLGPMVARSALVHRLPQLVGG